MLIQLRDFAVTQPVDTVRSLTTAVPQVELTETETLSSFLSKFNVANPEFQTSHRYWLYDFELRGLFAYFHDEAEFFPADFFQLIHSKVLPVTDYTCQYFALEHFEHVEYTSTFLNWIYHVIDIEGMLQPKVNITRNLAFNLNTSEFIP